MSCSSLTWSAWVPFGRQSESFRSFPTCPGVYRVRSISGDRLVYLGQTGRSLRERVRTLSLRTLDTQMPYNDPHTAAPNLWAWRDADGWSYEASVAETNLPDADRQGLECYLLWQHRLEVGESTLANHGRFHPCYAKSGSRASGRRGGRLPVGELNPAGGPSLAPLRPHGQSSDADWMGLPWSEWNPLTAAGVSAARRSPGLYRVVQIGEVAYVGESGDLRGRLQTHTRRWETGAMCSWVSMPKTGMAYQRHELENDLIGAIYAERGRSPSRQFGQSSRIGL